MTEVAMIEGIGESYKKKLSEPGSTTTEALLESGANSGRAEMAEKSGIDPSSILRWINQAELFRVDGIGEQYAELLEAAAVDSVSELSQRSAENLLQRLISEVVDGNAKQ